MKIRICSTFLAVFLFAASAWGQPTAPGPGVPEDVLAPVRQLIASADNEPSGLEKAIELLEDAALRFPRDYRIPLILAEAWYRMADPEGEIDRTWPLYEKTEEQAKKSLEIEPEQHEARYWYGLSQLKRAQKKGGFRAFFAARRGIAELEEVNRKIPRYDHAGAARVLSLLYTVAPGWSPFGDIEKAIDYGRRAVRLAPGYPLNRIYLARAYEKAGMMNKSAEQYREILKGGQGEFAEESEKKLEEMGMLAP